MIITAETTVLPGKWICLLEAVGQDVGYVVAHDCKQHLIVNAREDADWYNALRVQSAALGVMIRAEMSPPGTETTIGSGTFVLTRQGVWRQVIA